MVGFDKVADLWKRFEPSTAPKPYPSIALGVFEATPLEIASAYTVFASGGEMQRPRTVTRITNGGAALPLNAPAPMRVARPDTTFLVTNMMRSVINEGTAALGARPGLRPRRRGQDRHDERPARCLVRGVHARIC